MPYLLLCFLPVIFRILDIIKLICMIIIKIFRIIIILHIVHIFSVIIVKLDDEGRLTMQRGRIQRDKEKE